ncbi:9,11-endoperoxide prostaglandin H2 reductase [Halotydeus destructor]|nr:9,11-endoperoxide prostaglandin H2 reductase [Halotydeus destructor]
MIKDADDLKKILKEGLKVGYRRIDTAPDYENEEVIGDFLASEQFLKELKLSREDLFITTKIDEDSMGAEKCEESINHSIIQLKCDYLDLVIIHWPGPRPGEGKGVDTEDKNNAELRKETYKKLEGLCKSRRIKAIGVSNFTIRHLEELFEYCTIKPAVNQVEFHPMNYQKELLEFCEKHDIHLQGYSTLGSTEGHDELFSKSELRQIAEKKDKSIAQVLLKWSLCHGVSVNPKTTKVENLKENFELQSFDLNDKEIETIDKLNQGKHILSDPEKIR